MHRRIAVWMCVAVAIVVAGSLPACSHDSGMTGKPKKLTAAQRVERGKYLVNIASCNDCHTPLTMTEKGPAPDMSRMLSGHPQGMKLPPAPAAQGPWIWGGTASL